MWGEYCFIPPESFSMRQLLTPQLCRTGFAALGKPHLPGNSSCAHSTVGLVMMASCRNVETYAAAQVIHRYSHSGFSALMWRRSSTGLVSTGVKKPSRNLSLQMSREMWHNQIPCLSFILTPRLFSGIRTRHVPRGYFKSEELSFSLCLRNYPLH